MCGATAPNCSSRLSLQSKAKIMRQTGLTSYASALPEMEGLEERQWVQLLPESAAVPNDGRKPWRIDDKNAVVAASKAAIATGVPVDFDHALEAKAERRHAPAAGWVEDFEAREDGIWGLIAWTSEGREKIEGRMYRFISPVFEHTEDRRIVSIVRAGLTNVPALSMQAICAATDDTENEAGQSMEIDDTKIENVPEDQLRAVLKMILDGLGVSSSETVKGALDRIMGDAPPANRSSASSDTATLTGFANLLLEGSERSRAAENQRRVSTAMQSGKLPPALETWGIALCSSNPAAFDHFVEHSPLGYLAGEMTRTATTTRIGPEVTNGTAEAICAQLGLKPGTLNG